jgi:hypothetical protein
MCSTEYIASKRKIGGGYGRGWKKLRIYVTNRYVNTLDRRTSISEAIPVRTQKKGEEIETLSIRFSLSRLTDVGSGFVGLIDRLANIDSSVGELGGGGLTVICRESTNSDAGTHSAYFEAVQERAGGGRDVGVERRREGGEWLWKLWHVNAENGTDTVAMPEHLRASNKRGKSTTKG